MSIFSTQFSLSLKKKIVSIYKDFFKNMYDANYTV